MDQGVVVELGDGGTAEAWYEDICDLYRSIFSGPPFNRSEAVLDRQRRSLRSLMADPTFGIVTAVADGELVGFAYGVSLGSDTRWWQGSWRGTLPADEVTREWPDRTFALIDMAVAPAWRRRGIGRRLLEVLFTSRSEQRSSLAVAPEAQGTQAFYRQLGWHHVGRLDVGPGYSAPAYDKYVLPLQD